MKRYLVEVQEGEQGEQILPLPEELLKEAGWKEGDALQWKDNKDGSFSLSKMTPINTQHVLVETVSIFRQRYVVRVPEGKADWALDTVASEEAREFSQEHLAENIVSHRVLSEEEVITLFNTDNAYFNDSVTGETILTNYVTRVDSNGDIENP